MEPQHTAEILISWDPENCPAPNPYQAGLNAQNLLREFLPAGTPMTLKAYGNTHRKGMIEEDRVGFKDSGFPLEDTPDGKDAANRRMILDLFEFAREHPSPAYIAIITGDADFYQAAQKLRQMGYTVLVFSRPWYMSPDLDRACHRSFNWYNLRDKSGLFDMNGNQTHELQLAEVLEQDIPVKFGSSAMFVDLNSSHFPPTAHGSVIFQLLSQINLQVSEINPDDIDFIEIYGDQKNIPDVPDYIEGCDYFITRQEKTYHVLHFMTANILNFTHLNRAHPTYIIIVTGNERFSDLINVLKNNGYIVIVCVPNGRGAFTTLKNAASVFVRCPDWQLHGP